MGYKTLDIKPGEIAINLKKSGGYTGMFGSSKIRRLYIHQTEELDGCLQFTPEAKDGSKSNSCRILIHQSDIDEVIKALLLLKTPHEEVESGEDIRNARLLGRDAKNALRFDRTDNPIPREKALQRAAWFVGFDEA